MLINCGIGSQEEQNLIELVLREITVGLKEVSVHGLICEAEFTLCMRLCVSLTLLSLRKYEHSLQLSYDETVSKPHF